MSLLGTQVYANPDTPIWLGTTGGTINGTLNVNGSVNVSGTVDATVAVYSHLVQVTNVAGNDGTGTMLSLSTFDGDPADGMVLQGNLIRFGQEGTKNANTSFTPSTAGANLDLFAVGGTITCAIGPVPAQIITSNKTVNPIADFPASPSQFGVDTTITSISGAEYDVQVTGTVFCVSGTPAAGEYVVFNFTAGGSGSLSAVVFPSEVLLGGNGVTGIGPLTSGGAAATVTLRARIVSSASGTTLGANVRNFPQPGGAVYGAVLSVCDVQRVR